MRSKSARSILMAALFAVTALAGCTTVSENVATTCSGHDAMMDDGAMEANGQPTQTMMSTGDTSQPLRVGSLLPTTGSLSAFGESMEKAAQLAANQVNEAGGVNGKNLILLKGNSATDPAQAPTAFASLVNDGAVAVVGAASSGVTGSVLDAAVSNGVFVMSPASTAPSLTGDRDNEGWFARVPPSDALQGIVLADLVYDSGCHEVKTLAVNNAYGEGLGSIFKSHFESRGGTVLDAILFDDKATTFSSEVQRAGDGDPEAIVFIGYPDTGVQIMQDAFEKGVMEHSVFFFSEGVKDADGFVKVVGTKSDDSYILAGLKGTTPEVAVPEAFASAYMDAYGEEPTLFAAETYDAVIAFALAATYAGDNTGAGVKDGLRTVWNSPGTKVSADDLAGALAAAAQGDVDYVGVSNDFDLDENGDPVTGVYSVWQVGADGSINSIEGGITV